ncbi:hypothetical protein BDM02DRAFT_3122311 [Thelephora ganbajun]|uniref:Uncharacterized protein n=1 Tax=Thelephora ganbajun TaxID=370292 RepID=A0ACB6Z3T7_THEGA|nr:hypothetical protein BDM02DRAFT_3122311 [Thelephora ganbajun]
MDCVRPRRQSLDDDASGWYRCLGCRVSDGVADSRVTSIEQERFGWNHRFSSAKVEPWGLNKSAEGTGVEHKHSGGIPSQWGWPESQPSRKAGVRMDDGSIG